MTTPLDIRDVARRTGLTSRALRFYEARGLVTPVRTHTGRRLYGAAELEQLSRVLSLKRAGLTLAQIARLTAGQQVPLARLIEAQLAVIADKAAELAEARALLLSVKSRIDRGEPVDAATFCSLIRHEELTMSKDQWDKVSEEYLSPEAKADFDASQTQMPADFDQAAYSAKWADLGARAKAVVPHGADSPEAQAIYDEWQALLAPFKAIATPRMMAGVTTMYEKMDEWQDRADAPSPGFDAETFRFIQEVGRRRQG